MSIRSVGTDCESGYVSKCVTFIKALNLYLLFNFLPTVDKCLVILKGATCVRLQDKIYNKIDIMIQLLCDSSQLYCNA